MKLHTVNITEYMNGAISSIHSFSDDEEGNKEAEKYFKAILKEYDIRKRDIDIALEDGIYEENDWQVFLTHSS